MSCMEVCDLRRCAFPWPELIVDAVFLARFCLQLRAGFLMPLVQDLTDFAQSQLPELSDYDPALEDRSCKDPL